MSQFVFYNSYKFIKFFTCFHAGSENFSTSPHMTAGIKEKRPGDKLPTTSIVSIMEAVTGSAVMQPGVQP